MNKNTRNLLILAAVGVAYYFVWKNMKDKKASTPAKPNEPKLNVAGNPGGVVLPKGAKPELLMSSPGVCGWYYENSEGELVWIQSAPCPQAV